MNIRWAMAVPSTTAVCFPCCSAGVGRSGSCHWVLVCRVVPEPKRELFAFLGGDVFLLEDVD